MFQTNYFEGVLQLRSPINKVERFIDFYCGDHGLISDKQKVKNGFDYYFLSQKRLRSFGELLKRKFVGQMTVSAKIHTRDRQKSKDLYRATVLFKCYDLKEGQKVKFKGEEFILTRVDRKANIKRISDEKKFLVKIGELSV